MTPQDIIFLLITVLIGTAGQFFLKTGALKIVEVNATTLISRFWAIITIPELLIGLVCYGLAALGYILLLTRVKLSIVGPSVAVSYVFSLLMGYFIFHESIPLTRLVGLALIVSGVVLVIWKN